MTTIHNASNKKIAYMKGAPEIVLEKCTQILLNGKVQKLTQEQRTELHKVTEAMALQALRNLGFAYKELPLNITTLTKNNRRELRLRRYNWHD